MSSTLVSCPDCKKQISRSAIQCPGCGYPLQQKLRELSEKRKSQKSNKKGLGFFHWLIRSTLGLILGSLVCLMVLMPLIGPSKEPSLLKGILVLSGIFFSYYFSFKFTFSDLSLTKGEPAKIKEEKEKPPIESGEYKSFHDNGNLWMKGSYDKGKKVGEWLYYYDDGELDFTENYDQNGNLLE